jgi:hypothetical protein
MLSAFVNEELLIHSAAEAVLWEHTLNGDLHYLVRAAANEALGSLGLLASG